MAQRRSHIRLSRRGKLHRVRASWVRDDRSQSRPPRTRKCPTCGARILIYRMPNGGLAHFEGGRGLGGVKHPCFGLGEGLSRRRDDETPDLFDGLAADASTQFGRKK